jgi:hypothetical protein
VSETEAEAEFLVRLGAWPRPECAIYRNRAGNIFYRYDYDMDAWTVIGTFPSVARKADKNTVTEPSSKAR